jgi:hypothetical protein
MASTYSGTRDERILEVQKALAAFLKQRGGKASTVAILEFIMVNFSYTKKLAEDYISIIKEREIFAFDGYDFRLRGEKK